MERTKVQIVQMSQHFLYLPLYYASYRGFFGLIPRQFDLEIVNASEKTDICAYEMLMDTNSPDSQFIDFAICDPVSVFHKLDEHGKTPVLLAGIITNAAFWAVDRGSHEVTFLKDLGLFDQIIAFDRGTTSYGIAARVLREAGRKEGIKPVDPGQELIALRQSEKGTVALSPDVLAVHQLITHNQVFNIDLDLGRTPEYSNVLVTTLITRQDVIQKKKALVAGLLRAIQRSMLLVKFGDSDVVKFAAERFNSDIALAKRAIERANDSQVFPTSIEISEAHWMNAARAAWDSRGQDFDSAAQLQVKKIYEQYVKPHSHFSWEVGQELLPQLAASGYSGLPAPPLSWRKTFVVAGCLSVFLSLAFLLDTLRSVGPIALAAFGALLGVLPGWFFGLKRRTKFFFAHWLLWMLLVCTSIAWSTSQMSGAVFLGAFLTLFVADIGVLIANDIA